MAIGTEIYGHWEKDKTALVAANSGRGGVSRLRPDAWGGLEP
jgi:hypothetical protein